LSSRFTAARQIVERKRSRSWSSGVSSFGNDGGAGVGVVALGPAAAGDEDAGGATWTMAAGGAGDTGDAELQATRNRAVGKRAVGRRARSGVADTDSSIPAPRQGRSPRKRFDHPIT